MGVHSTRLFREVLLMGLPHGIMFGPILVCGVCVCDDDGGGDDDAEAFM